MVDSIVINKDEPTTAEKPVEEAQVETTQEEVAATPEAEKILGKFDTQEDLEKAYKELESKIGSPKEETKEEPTLDIPEGNAEEVADLVAYLAGPDSSFMTGNNVDINGGLAFS